MYAIHTSDGEPFKCAGNNYVMLLPRDVTHCCEVVLEKVAPGHCTPPNAHPTFHQVYVVLAGEADVTIGSETQHLSGFAVAYIPINTNHYVTNNSLVEFQYLYVTIWPSGIPAEEIDGGWKNVYDKMIQEYADRGYAVE